MHESAELSLPFRVINDFGFLLHQPMQDKHRFPFERKVANLVNKRCQSNGEADFQRNSMEISGEFDEDFDAEAIFEAFYRTNQSFVNPNPIIR